ALPGSSRGGAGGRDEGSPGMKDLELLQHEVPFLRWFGLDWRRFLQLFGGGLLVVLAAPDGAAVMEAQESGRTRSSGQELPKDLAAWLHIDKNGRVTVFTGKVEKGQNIRTSLS